MQTQSALFPSLDHGTDSPFTVRLVDHIGSGSTGVVFRAERFRSKRPVPSHESTAENVAVKLPREETSLSDEAAALKRFNHPNIVALIEDHTANRQGKLAGSIVIELCSEGTLEQLAMQRALTAGQVHLVVESISSALDVIHQAGWIHGDVTPSNIGFRANQPPCLFDFETCRRANGTPTTPDTRATEEFSTPNLPNSPVFDARSLAATALWALGAPEEFSFADERIADGLRIFISQCDAGDAAVRNAPLDQLRALFDTVPLSNTAASFNPVAGAATSTFQPPDTNPHPMVGGPDKPRGPRTRSFGPRPRGGDGESSNGDESQDRSTNPLSRSRALAIVAALAFVSLIAIEMFAGDVPQAGAEPTSSPVSRVSSEQTLEAAGAAWSTDRGSIELVIDGVATSFAPGQRGDIGAIGDWNCDGETTLGVFRPSTGSWFTFGGWGPNTTSSVALLTNPNAEFDRLWVHTDTQGCAMPALS